MWDRKELKAKGKAAFKGNYWASVVVAIVVSILTAGTVSTTGRNQLTQLKEMVQSSNDTGTLIAIIIGVLTGSLIVVVIAVLIDMFITNPLTVGCNRFFVRNSEEKAPLGLLFSAYKDGRFGQVFITMFLTDLFTFLWTLLFIIPGIVKAYSYRMVPYILADHPEMSGTEVITLSRQMMDGNKWKSFVLDISFIGWYILATITCGIVGVLYVNPYVQATNAELYMALRK